MTIPNDVPLMATDFELGPTNFANRNQRFYQNYSQVLERLGTKQCPIDVGIGQIHPDNVWMEAATTPHQRASDVIMNIESLRNHLQSLTDMPNYGYDYVELPMDMIGRDITPFLWRQSREFGCSPDKQYGEWRGDPLPGGGTRPPAFVKGRALREAGTHIHMQLRPNVRGNEAYVMSFLENYEQEISPLLRWDHATEEPWYRQRGVYRMKEYGVEYRSLGASVLNTVDSMYTLFGITEAFLNDHWYGRRAA
jgi:hypothetical protein